MPHNDGTDQWPEQEWLETSFLPYSQSAGSADSPHIGSGTVDATLTDALAQATPAQSYHAQYGAASTLLQLSSSDTEVVFPAHMPYSEFVSGHPHSQHGQNATLTGPNSFEVSGPQIFNPVTPSHAEAVVDYGHSFQSTGNFSTPATSRSQQLFDSDWMMHGQTPIQSEQPNLANYTGPVNVSQTSFIHPAAERSGIAQSQTQLELPALDPGWSTSGTRSPLHSESQSHFPYGPYGVTPFSNSVPNVSPSPRGDWDSSSFGGSYSDTRPRAIPRRNAAIVSTADLQPRKRYNILRARAEDLTKLCDSWSIVSGSRYEMIQTQRTSLKGLNIEAEMEEDEDDEVFKSKAEREQLVQKNQELTQRNEELTEKLHTIEGSLKQAMCFGETDFLGCLASAARKKRSAFCSLRDC
ncbi:hypothetical protein IAU59_002615 [Kwoniella sp. CBS 9459]